MTNFEQGLEKLEELKAWAEAHEPEISRNEAATRLHLIDELLMGCLAWPREEISPEEYHNNEFADYVIGAPSRLLLVEAKREGAYFDLPADTPRIVKLRTLFRASDELKSAIEQALGYALDQGMMFGAVCNGRQLIAFLASRQDGVRPREGRALVFHSLEDMVDEFRLLWDNLSKPGCEGRGLTATLGGDTPSPPPEKLSARIRGYPGFAQRSDLETELQILGELFIHDIAADEDVEDEFLRECYCPSGAVSQYAVISREILQARYSAALGEELGVALEPVRDRDGLNDKLVADIAAATFSTRPIIILGDVGVGKTMFLRHLMRVDAKELADRSIVLYVDLGNEPALGELRPFISRRFEDQLLDTYGIDINERNFVRGVYNRDLEQFRTGIWGALYETNNAEYRLREAEFLAEKAAEKEAHLRASLEHLSKAQRRQVIVILDNVDQRDSGFQDQVFVIAQSLAGTWPGTVFVTLRPDSFYHSRQAGALTAYQPRVFTIPPPRVDRVVEKRIDFGRRQIAEHGRLPSFPEGVTLQAETLDAYLDILGYSFGHSEQLAALLDNLSGGNVRQALEYLTMFVGSPHTGAARALEVQANTGFFQVPPHQFLRAVLLGDNRYYSPKSSRIPNAFDISAPDGREHFLLSIILAMLARVAVPGGDDEGYVTNDRVFGFCQDLGFTPSQVSFQLGRGVATRLIDAMPSDSVPHQYRITSVGAYLQQHLIQDFPYVDEVIVDTPIVDDAARAEIADVSATARRLERCRTFCAYLDQEWQPLADRDTGLEWPSVSAHLVREIDRIAGRLAPGPRPA